MTELELELIEIIGDFIISTFIISPGYGIACLFIARSKNLNMRKWFFLGYFFGLIAIIIVALKQAEDYKSNKYQKVDLDKYFVPKTTEEEKIKKELDKNKRLYDDGIIGEEEYKKQLQRIKHELYQLRSRSGITQQIKNESQTSYSKHDKYQSVNIPQVSYNKRIEEILEDYNASSESKLAQLKALKKEKKITEEEYRKAISRV